MIQIINFLTEFFGHKISIGSFVILANGIKIPEEYDNNIGKYYKIVNITTEWDGTKYYWINDFVGLRREEIRWYLF